ncbi:DUF4349 domain-containing protein [Chryseobacterium sp. MP_3.2]|uniref:DUF4349 domain-containing protein n=1 Tax=Chryseobacterium sp. MP_3.2 TaxID=3071712 RepID=UPI002E1395B9
MKNPIVKSLLVSTLFFSVSACNKNENSETAYRSADLSSESSVMMDSVSTVATLQVKEKQFIKTAEVSMEVKDVYESTIAIENTLKNLGGFVTSSRLNSNIISENTYNTSDNDAILVRKFQTQNTMQVRIPTEKLGDFLTQINNLKLFLNSRNILAEDVTANIKLAELEAKRNAKIAGNIEKIANNKVKVILANENESEGNYQKNAAFQISDQIKYSTVELLINEPQMRIAEIGVINTSNIDQKYGTNFFYEVKNSLIQGFYLIQKLIIGLLSIWPMALLAAIVLYFFKKRKITEKATSIDLK